MTELPVVANYNYTAVCSFLCVAEMPTDEMASCLSTVVNLKKKGPALPFTGSPVTRYPKLVV